MSCSAVVALRRPHFERVLRFVNHGCDTDDHQSLTFKYGLEGTLPYRTGRSMLLNDSDAAPERVLKLCMLYERLPAASSKKLVANVRA